MSIAWVGGCGSAAGGGGGVATSMRLFIFLLERLLSILTSLPRNGGGDHRRKFMTGSVFTAIELLGEFLIKWSHTCWKASQVGD